MQAGPRQERFESLDVLRGVAILGIFAVNILAFGFPWYAISNPTIVPELYRQGGAFWWTVSETLFQMKFITLFTAMFGAGVVLMVGEEKPSPKTAIHRTRMFWLFVIGMIHNYVFWYGDILVPYAIAGLIVAGARTWTPRRLLIVAAVLIALNFGVLYAQQFAFQYMSPEELDTMIAQMWAPPPDALEEEFELYRSGFFERVGPTAFDSFMSQIMQGLIFALRTIGIMMAGMALYKSGFLTLRWSAGVYFGLGAACAGIGAAGSYWAAQHSMSAGFDMLQSYPSSAALYWASLVQSFGYAALVMGLCTIAKLKPLRAPFAAAGRMALTNYLASTFIGVFIFYGPPGLGKIGTMGFDGLAKVVAGVWLFILVWSPIWLALFRFGPFEWLWRTLTYGRAQPILR